MSIVYKILLEGIDAFKNKSSIDSYLDIKNFWRAKIGYDEEDNAELKKQYFEQHGKPALVSIDDIIPNQDYLDSDTVDRYRNESGNLPLGVKINGKVIVFDGHHRIVSKILDGKTVIKMKLVA